MTRRPARSQVPVEQTWDLESLYPTISAWELDLARVDAELPAISAFQGRLGDGAATLLACLEHFSQVKQLVDRVYWYAYNRSAVEQGDPVVQGLVSRAGALAARAEAAWAFMQPEIAALPDGLVSDYLETEPALAPYRLFLLDILQERAHMLGAEAEAVIAHMSELADAPRIIWENTTAADMQFAPITDEQGNQVPMALERMFRMLQSHDRTVRQAAYESATDAFLAHKRTIAASIGAIQKRDVVLAKLRRYPNSLAAALAPAHLPESLFRNLIQVAEEGAKELRRYATFRQRALGLDQLYLYDMQAPLDADADTSITFSDARALLMRALEPLGPEYLAIVAECFANRWIDWADNDGKRSGAYSYSCYGYHPIVLMTWQGSMADVFTLAHEVGHAVHSVLCSRSQPYITSGYSHFLSEMASTTTELLLAQYLLKQADDRGLRRFVLTRAIQSFMTNFWGGTQLATLQLAMHEAVERGEPLTYESITAMQTDVHKRWYGETVSFTEEQMGFNWMRTLHHFRNYYSYQYATGISAAAAFTDAILTEGQPAVERYLNFLRSGSSAHDIELLKRAGLDMTTPEPIHRAVAYFARLVTELEQL